MLGRETMRTQARREARDTSLSHSGALPPELWNSRSGGEMSKA